MVTDTIIEQLSKETGMYIKLQSVLEEEREAVVKRDYQGLYDVLSEKDKALGGLSSLAASRGKFIAIMLKDAGREQEKGLNALIGLKYGAERVSLEAARDNLAGVREKVVALNQKNRLLIRSSLQNLGHALDFLESFFMGGTYLSTGLRGGLSLKGTRLRKGV